MLTGFRSISADNAASPTLFAYTPQNPVRSSQVNVFGGSPNPPLPSFPESSAGRQDRRLARRVRSAGFLLSESRKVGAAPKKPFCYQRGFFALTFS